VKNNPWNIKLNDFPEQADLVTQIHFVLALAILAPSTHNSQPWLFKISGEICEVYADRTIKLPQSDPTGRDLFISLGCLAEQINLVGRYYGLNPDIKFLNKSFDGPIFSVSFSKQNKDLNLQKNIETILTRINVRGLFNKKELPENIIQSLKNIYSDQFVESAILVGYDKTKSFGKITAAAISQAHCNNQFRNELSQWMRHSLTKKLNGLVGYNLRIPFILSFIFPPLIRIMNLGFIFSKLNYQAIASAPAVCILTTQNDDPISWWQVGRRFQAMNLYLNSQDIRTSIYVGSIEIGNHRQSVQNLIQTSRLPQFSFVIGYMSGKFPHSPRQPLSLKLLHE
jgi:hypothetical protein